MKPQPAPSPAFQFYPNDWLSSPRIMLMTPAEEGAYIRLLALDWANDGIPDDDEQLAALSRLGDTWFNNSHSIVKQCFMAHPSKVGMLTNPRLQKIREAQIAWRNQKVDAGRSGATSRWRGPYNKAPKTPTSKDLPLKQWFSHEDGGAIIPPSSENGGAIIPPSEKDGSLSLSSKGTEEINNPAGDSSKTSRGTEATVSEVIVPSLAEVLEWGRIDGVPAEICQKFYDHNQGLGWMYGPTRIRNPRYWLKTFMEKRRSVSPRGPRKESAGSLVYQKKVRMEALLKEIEEHPGHPNANYSDPATPAQRKEYERLMDEVKKVRRELAQGAPL